jgi:hypothetical protein
MCLLVFFSLILLSGVLGRLTGLFGGHTNPEVHPALTSPAPADEKKETAPPVVFINPSDRTVFVGEDVFFQARATDSPRGFYQAMATGSVQWQVSTDGGETFTDITGNATATTEDLRFPASATQKENGYKYGAVFTNRVGSTTTTIATLKVNAPPKWT